MDNRAINKKIRAISNRGSLLPLIFLAVAIPIKMLFHHLNGISSEGSLWRETKFVYFLTEAGKCLILYPFLYLLYYKLLNKKNELHFKDVFKKPQRSKRWIFKWTVIALGFSFLIERLFMFAAQALSKERSSTATEVYSDNSVFGWILYAAALIVLAPIFEELLFRGTIYRNNEPIGQLPAAIITGITFGMWHLAPTQAIGAAVLGIFLCLIFAGTRSIFPAMIIHSIFNLIVFLLTFLRSRLSSFLSLSDKEFMIHAMFHNRPIFACMYVLLGFLLIILMIVAPIILIIEIAKKNSDFHPEKGNISGTAWKKTAVFLSAPVTIILFVFMILLMFL